MEADTSASRQELVFSPLAWMKLMFFLHGGDTEVGGFAVTRDSDPLYVVDFRTVRQRVTFASVAFDDAAVADYFDDCVDQGLQPAQFARVWLHTHPGESPTPSLTDEQTFDRVFAKCDWAVMFIVGRTGRTYARMRFAAGPGGQVELGVAVDWASWAHDALEEPEAFAARLVEWADEFGRNIWPEEPLMQLTGKFEDRPADRPGGRSDGGRRSSLWSPFGDDVDAYEDDARDPFGSDLYDPTVDWWLDRESARLYEEEREVRA